MANGVSRSSSRRALSSCRVSAAASTRCGERGEVGGVVWEVEAVAGFVGEPFGGFAGTADLAQKERDDRP